MAEVANTGSDLPANQTIYINNLNEKIKLEEVSSGVFSQFGKILEVLAFKTLKHKGQAWVVFEEVSPATNALRQMQGFPFYDEPIHRRRIQYAKTKSDIIAKADGTFVPREKRKRHDERGKKRKEQNDANQAAAGLNYAGAYGVAPPVSQVPYMGGPPVVPEAPAAPNNILFIQNLPHGTTPLMLQVLFGQYPGFKEVCMVEAKPGIAFVEYENEMQ
ncbi:hypothetical protein Cgig2_029421 [Carnegiea gigantea]|uniref:RRM domain-containing protein n=1 Tax=Carnegiea gigantea TaxID=171969 RepID=A0A9Q1JIH5_9CARY|nr:hypothetical protein Cgig2_029421 [Carnegiea gigantea]